MKILINKSRERSKWQIADNILVIACFLLGMAACTFDTNEYKPIEVPDTVSFAGDIAMPIFDVKCAYSGCHADNGIPPNLTPAKAYNSLQSGYINTGDPEQSLLYQKINTGGSMAVYATDQDRKLILTWIEQGAPNN